MNPRAIEFAAFIAARESVERRIHEASARMDALGAGSGPMGLTPDDVKFSSSFRQARTDCDDAMRTLRSLNARNVKRFAIELRQERDARRQARLAMP